MRKKRFIELACAATVMGAMFGPASGAWANSNPVTINGSGSTLVAPIEAEWAAAWDSNTGNTVNYALVGSGEGESNVAQGLDDFGASDAPLSAYASSQYPCSNCVQMPWALTATGVSFHINSLNHLHLTGNVIAQIYLGKIRNWDNSQIKALNHGVSLPNLPIAVFYRQDASGDSYAFTRYESDVDKAFNSQVGATLQPVFPVGTAVAKNSGMASAVQQTNGAIAYVAVSYLINDNLPAAGIRNAAGNYEVPNLNNIEDAAQVIHSVPSDNQVTIVDPPKSAKSAYVISTFTYVIVPRNASKVPQLKQFIYYALTGGQQFAASLDFARIPKVVLKASENTLNQVH